MSSPFKALSEYLYRSSVFPTVVLGICGVSFTLPLVVPASARADETYVFTVKKQEEKAKNRWSIDQWLETRDKMRLMDLWLVLHSPSPYEFFFSGAYQIAGVTTASLPSGFDFSAAAYASMFGLQVDRLSTQGILAGTGSTWHGLFKWRFFGFHAQGTNITAEAGVRSAALSSGSFRNFVLGGSTALYFNRFIGIDGGYRHYFSPTPTAGGAEHGGFRLDGGGFIEFKALRIFGKVIYEQASFADLTTSSGTGAQIGVKFFF